MKYIILALTLAQLNISFADYKDFYFKRAQNVQISKSKPEAFPTQVNAQWFDQKISHFDKENLETFKQRYYVNNKYAKSADAPVLLYICGESTCHSSSVTRGAIVEYAEVLNAKIVALEHRYYGKSQPFKKLTTENLKYLSTDEAIEDLSYFQASFTQKHGLTGKWIAIGGSYPGSLAAYYRLKYPNLVVGALASSAPVKAKAKFNEYDAHVAKVVGQECATNMWDAIWEVEMVMDIPKEMAKIKAKFNASDIEGNVDFLYFMADIGAMAAQYGFVTPFCNALKNARTALDGYAQFAKKTLTAYGMRANDINIAAATSTDPADYETGFGMRQWLYQSCTEYGYWQVADNKNSVRSSLIDLDYHNGVCKKLFDLTTPVDTTHINETFYKPLLESKYASNIFFTNGSTDPWLNLSLLPEEVDNELNTYFVIMGAAHCNDLHSSSANDSSDLKLARIMFMQLMATWLNE